MHEKVEEKNIWKEITQKMANETLQSNDVLNIEPRQKLKFIINHLDFRHEARKWRR